MPPARVRTKPPVPPITDVREPTFTDNPLFESTDTPKVEKPISKVKPGALARSLADMYGAIGFGVSMFDQSCGQVIIIEAESMANSMEKLAMENESVRRVLERLLSVNAIGQVIAAHMPVIMGIARHHAPGLKAQHMEHAA